MSSAVSMRVAAEATEHISMCAILRLVPTDTRFLLKRRQLSGSVQSPGFGMKPQTLATWPRRAMVFVKPVQCLVTRCVVSQC